YKGRIVKFVGDAVLAEFSSTELSVRAATALSRDYREGTTAAGGMNNLRIGVHLADVAMAPDGDLYGDGVNAAARIQEAAEPGQVLVSQDVWRQLRGRREFHFLPLGDRSLKGIGSIGLYAVNVQGDRLPPASPSRDTGARQGKERAISSLAVLPFADL